MIATSRVDSPLGSWSVTQWDPIAGERLGDALLKIWLFEGTTTFACERLFPDVSLEIVMQLDATYRRVDIAAEPFAPLSIGGIRTAAMTIAGPGRPVRVLGLRLRPAGAFGLLRTSLAALTDHDYDLHDVIGAAAAELAERCDGARSGTACVRAALDWAARRLERAPQLDRVVAEVVSGIEADGGAVAVSEIAAATQRSRSRLAAQFRDQAGVAPKQFARIVRFRRALDMLLAGHASLGAVAARSGYYDQAHMNAEFRSLAGLTPRGFRSARHYPNSVSLAENDPASVSLTEDDRTPGSFFQDEMADRR